MGKPYPKAKDRNPPKVLRVKMVGPKARSVKKRREMVARNKLSIELRRARGDGCEGGIVGCTSYWTDMHEVLARSQGGDPLDPDNVLCLCRNCHQWAHRNPREALSSGLRESRQVQCA